MLEYVPQVDSCCNEWCTWGSLLMTFVLQYLHYLFQLHVVI